MTIEAIESGEGLMLNALCDTATANRFGKYSEVLALVTTSMSEQYGLSATIECAVGLVVIAPPKVEAPKSGDDAEDNASDYFNNTPTIDLDDDEDASEETTQATKGEDDATEAAEAPKAEAKADGEGWTAGSDDDEWDDDWD